LPYAILEIDSKLAQQRKFSGNPAGGNKEGSRKKVRPPKQATVYTTKKVSRWENLMALLP
jgi:hypothetical protein